MKKVSIIIAHYDVEGNVCLDIILLLMELKKISNEIIFVSTKLNKNSKAKISNLCKVIVRDNFGYDFWSYKVGIESINNLEILDSILILNTSVIYFNPQKLVSKFFENKIENPTIYGLTQSNQHVNHIQSFWFEFNTNELINSNYFLDWWDKMTPISAPSEVIKKYELGMSQYFREKGVSLETLYNKSGVDKILSSSRVISSNPHLINKEISIEDYKALSIPIGLGDKTNPMTILWDVILNKYDFIKVKSFGDLNLHFSPYIFKKYLLKNPELFENNIKILKSRKINYK